MPVFHGHSARAWVVLIVAVFAGLLCAPAGASAASEVRVVGGGWGHGIGLSQYGAQGFARRGTTWPNIVRYYYSGSAVRRLTGGTYNPVMRVRLQGTMDSAMFRLDSGGRVTVSGTSTSRTVAAGTRLVFRRDSVGGKVLAQQVSPSGARTNIIWWTSAPLVLNAPTGATYTQFSANNGHANRRYRGSYTIRLEANRRIAVVNNVTLEEYLRSVVPCEVPSSWDGDAIAAQAVAARSYAWVDRQSPRSSYYDVHPDTQDQMYCGLEHESTAASAAVARTSGYFVTHAANGNRPIQAFFSSTSGGWTSRPRDVWGSGAAELPWLQSVRDPWEQLGGSPYWQWVYRFPESTIASRLGIRPGTITSTTTALNPSRRASSVTIAGTAGRSTLTGATVQSRLGLRTTRFQLERLAIVSSASSVVAGSRVRLSGAIPADGTTYLCAQRTGQAWSCTLNLATVRSGTAWAATVSVPATTRYALKRGAWFAPIITVTTR